MATDKSKTNYHRRHSRVLLWTMIGIGANTPSSFQSSPAVLLELSLTGSHKGKQKKEKRKKSSPPSASICKGVSGPVWAGIRQSQAGIYKGSAMSRPLLVPLLQGMLMVPSSFSCCCCFRGVGEQLPAKTMKALLSTPFLFFHVVPSQGKSPFPEPADTSLCEGRHWPNQVMYIQGWGLDESTGGDRMGRSKAQDAAAAPLLLFSPGTHAPLTPPQLFQREVETEQHRL